jgi:ABC transporter substrate binding protein
MQQLAKELIALRPDLIQATTPATAAVLRETHTIPVVFSIVSDSLGSGFVENFARPGGNATGFVNLEDSLAGLGLSEERKRQVRNEMRTHGSQAVRYNYVDALRVVFVTVIVPPPAYSERAGWNLCGTRQFTLCGSVRQPFGGAYGTNTGGAGGKSGHSSAAKGFVIADRQWRRATTQCRAVDDAA